MLTLDQLANPSDSELPRLDIAEVDLACAHNLPGAERLDIPACLAWVDRAAAWVRQHTAGVIGQFDHSEGIFRVVAMMSVLQRGMGANYIQNRVDALEAPTDSRDSFLHGLVEGHGGTCASLPVLYAAVGRRLGYPIKLVPTARHLFARWDDPVRERFNIEINGTGLNSYPDEYYLRWPVPIEGTEWEFPHYVRSMTPREEVAHAWCKRGLCLCANGRLREGVHALATACSIVADNDLTNLCLQHWLNEWRKSLASSAPARTPGLRIYFPPQRRYPGLAIDIERKIIVQGVIEGLLVGAIPEVERVTYCVLQ
jgi:hypothetical protein